ncbi:MAG TPA: TolC family protein [Candidatus Binataceae bacterium]|nr:TolC family protein [Candidatus Binataceae bacterium]
MEPGKSNLLRLKTSPDRATRCRLSLLSAAALALTLGGCGEVPRLPELTPDSYVASSVTQQWSAAGTTSHAPDTIGGASLAASPPVRDRSDSPYSLAELIDVALTHNPETRVAWEQARADAAAWGRVRAAYYPKVATETDFEYSRTIFQIGGGNGRIKTAQITPMVELTYTLLDFGRRRASSDAAREQLAAANFSFNRAMQEVVFNTERFFYALAAAKAAVQAAHRNLELARTDDDAVSQRVAHGLATRPELLLSRQRVAQAEYDVANAELSVEEAQANLALSLGIAANDAIEVNGLAHQQIPTTLAAQVDDLINQAIVTRPDLAAAVATVRAGDASIRRARSEFMPEVDILGNYGEQNWGYTFNAAPQIQGNLPQYTALLALKWDVFTGFSRLNAVREAEANRRERAATLQSRELAAIAEVWRAYYEFQSSRKRYDFARALLSASQESYDSLLDTYRQGLSTIVELLSADRDLANARYTMIQSTADLLTASAAAAYAVGAVPMPPAP